MAAFRLIPREEKFYADFIALADRIVSGATLLEKMLATDPPAWEMAIEIKQVEEACDSLTHEIIQRLNRTFVTPIDWVCRKTAPTRVDQLFRRLQLVSAALYSLGHGSNDAQKTMGIIAGALFAGGYITTFDIPTWVVFAAYAAISLGTLSGGWRIIHTMGSKITRLQPVGGFAAETAGAVSLFLASSLGVPVSTTHTITGAIVGVGSVRRLSAVRWGIAGQIVWAWVLTIPASAVIAAATYYVLAASGIR